VLLLLLLAVGRPLLRALIAAVSAVGAELFNAAGIAVGAAICKGVWCAELISDAGTLQHVLALSGGAIGISAVAAEATVKLFLLQLSVTTMLHSAALGVHERQVLNDRL
jgi:hypothetical protein